MEYVLLKKKCLKKPLIATLVQVEGQPPAGLFASKNPALQIIGSWRVMSPFQYKWDVAY